MDITQGQGQITPMEQNFDVTKTFYYFNHTVQISAVSL